MLERWMTENKPVTQLREEMDRLFGRFFAESDGGRRFHFALFPLMNLWEDDNKVYVEAEMPGVEEGDFELLVTGNELTLKGERPEMDVKKDMTVYRRELREGEFRRTVQLPVAVKEDKAQATLRNGILTITIPKAEAARTRRIKVKALAD